MTFELFCPVYNESYILPYLVKFYRDLLGKDKITFNFYDNGSSDDTIEVARSLGCNVGVYETGGEVRDDLLMDFKNNIWKKSSADYVIVIDADEFVEINPAALAGYTILKSEGYNMIGNGSQTPDQITLGTRFHPEDKTCVFSPKHIQDINYSAGAHNCDPVGILKWCPRPARLYHIKFISEDYAVEKYRSSRERLSQKNKEMGWGSHYQQDEDYVRQLYRFGLQQSELSKVRSIIIPITFTITTCNRLDLLARTIDSFRRFNTYPISRFIMTDDSADPEVARKLDELYGSTFTIIHNTEQIGLSKNLDKLFPAVDTEYIFHCEDDWEFNASGFVEESLQILETRSDIHQVWVRHQSDLGHKCMEDLSIPLWANWNGYSWNPGLRRKSDYSRMFPDGLSCFGTEIDCMQHTKQFDYRVVTLKDTACFHIGYNRHTDNFIS